MEYMTKRSPRSKKLTPTLKASRIAAMVPRIGSTTMAMAWIRWYGRRRSSETVILSRERSGAGTS